MFKKYNVRSLFNKTTGQLSGMMIITTLTQIIAVYKSSIIAANFGAGVELDAYNFANNIATFFLTFISAGMTTVVIPAYIKKLDRKALDTFLTVLFLVTGCLLIAIYCFRGQIVDVLSSRDAVFKGYVSGIMAITILIQLFPALLGVTTAYFQCIDKFNLPKLIMFVSNAMVVIVLTVRKNYSLQEYLYVLLGGAVIQFAVDLIYAVKYGFRFKLSFDIKNTEFREMLRVFLPTLFSTGIYKINTLIDSLISTNLGTGKLTILSYSNLVVTMVNTLIVGNLITYAYPKIVEKVSSNNTESRNALWKYVTDFHIVVCLLMVGFVCVGREFVGILFEHGEFTSEAAQMLYICMCIYMLDQQNNIVRDLIYRYFFAHGDTKNTVKNGISTSVINIVLSLILVRFFGIYGVVAGTLAAGTFSLVSIIIRYKKRFGFLVDVKPVFLRLLADIIASAVSILLVLLLKHNLNPLPNIWSFMVYGMLAVLVYGVFMVVLSKSKHLKLSDNGSEEKAE